MFQLLARSSNWNIGLLAVLTLMVIACVCIGEARSNAAILASDPLNTGPITPLSMVPEPVPNMCEHPEPSLLTNSRTSAYGNRVHLQVKFYQLLAESNSDPMYDHYIVYAAVVVSPNKDQGWSLTYKGWVGGDPCADIWFGANSGVFENSTLRPTSGYYDAANMQLSVGSKVKGNISEISFGISWTWRVSGLRVINHYANDKSITANFQFEPLVPRLDERLWRDQLFTSAIHYYAHKGTQPRLTVNGCG